MDETKKTPSRFPPLFWLVVVFEFVERGSYYGMMSILSVYLTEQLLFSKGQVGVIKSTIQPLLYFLPIVAGALADRFGYRRTLLVAFSLMGTGYFLTSQSTGYAAVFLSLVVMGLGAGTFKPVISGTIARCTDESNSTLGFGIFYWSINLGAFLVPLFLVPYLKSHVGGHAVMLAAAIGTSSLILPTLFLYREPPRLAQAKANQAGLLVTLMNAFEIIYSPFAMLYHKAFGTKARTPLPAETVSRYRDHLRFLLLIFIYAGFWVLYFQMFDSVLWYVRAYVDASSLNRAVNAGLSRLGLAASWKFDVEHVTVINAGTIILLQILVSSIVKRFRALPTMIVGIGLGTVGMAILSISTGIWVFLLGIFIFSIGEMTAHPKFISYVGQTAPRTKVALYMGYLFLYGVIGSSIGGILGAKLYVLFVDEMKAPRTLWLIFSGIGLATMLGLGLYNRFLPPKVAAEHG